MLSSVPLFVAILFGFLEPQLQPVYILSEAEKIECLNCMKQLQNFETYFNVQKMKIFHRCIEPNEGLKLRTFHHLTFNIWDSSRECLLQVVNLHMYLHKEQQALVDLVPALKDRFVLKYISELRHTADEEMRRLANEDWNNFSEEMAEIHRGAEIQFEGPLDFNVSLSDVIGEEAATSITGRQDQEREKNMIH